MKIARVEWLDSDNRAGWAMRDDLNAWLTESIVRCVTVGFVLHEDKKQVILAQSHNPYNWGNVLKIPRFAVKKIEILKEDEPQP